MTKLLEEEKQMILRDLTYTTGLLKDAVVSSF